MDCAVGGPHPRRSGHTCAVDGPWAGIGSNTEPSPTAFQSTIRGSGVHGVWLDTRSISAITGRRSAGASSRRCNAASVYWSGMVA